MALVDVDSWTTEFESCSRLSQTLLSQLNQRAGKINNSPDYNRLTLSIQVGLKQYDREFQQLKVKLNDAANGQTISLDEIEIRKQQLNALKTQRQQLQEKYMNAVSNERHALLGRPSNSIRPNNETAEDSDAAPIIETNDVQRLKQYQSQMVDEQNSSLETLSKTIARQREITLQFGQEVEEQNVILDNLANTIERVETGVSRETRNISLINRRDSRTCGYWIVIIILFIAIIIAITCF